MLKTTEKTTNGVVVHPKNLHATSKHRPRSARGKALPVSNGSAATPASTTSCKTTLPPPPPLPSSKRRKRSARRRRSSKSACSAAGGGGASAAPPPHDVPVLLFAVENLFCFGSPVGLFLNVRGQKITREFKLPTCRRVFNIYHPYDPVAYRIEPLLNPRRAHSKATIIRTFEGKLRFQYQIRNSFRRMWQKLRQWRRNFETQVETAVRRVGLVETATPALGYDGSSLGAASSTALSLMTSPPVPPERVSAEPPVPGRFVSATEREDGEYGGGRWDVFGKLCQGLPIDYSLQENEIEITNEYLFALTSHVIYWGNRDASLFVAQKMILEPPVESDSDEEDEDDAFGGEDEDVEEYGNGITVQPSGSISPAFSAFSSRANSMALDDDDDDA